MLNTPAMLACCPSGDRHQTVTGAAWQCSLGGRPNAAVHKQTQHTACHAVAEQCKHTLLLQLTWPAVQVASMACFTVGVDSFAIVQQQLQPCAPAPDSVCTSLHLNLQFQHCTQLCQRTYGHCRKLQRHIQVTTYDQEIAHPAENISVEFVMCSYMGTWSCAQLMLPP